MTWGAGLINLLQDCDGPLHGFMKVFKNTSMVHVGLFV